MDLDHQKKITPWKRFFKLLTPDIKEIRNLYIYAVFAGLISLSLPLGIQAIVNLIQGGSLNSSWVVMIIVVVVGVVFSGILQLFQLRITEDLKQKIFSRAAFEFAYRVPKVKLEELYKKYAPELMNRFFDIIAVQKSLAKILMDFSTALIQMIFGLILLSFYHPFFIAFSLVLVSVLVIIVKLTAKKGLATSIQESKYKYAVVHWLEDLARSSTTFKLAGENDLIMKRTNEWNGKYINARESHFKILMGQYSMLIVFKVIVVTGLLALGGFLVMEQMMNLGQFVAAEIVILVVINSVEKLILNVDIIYDVLTSLEKVGQVVDMELEKEEGREFLPVENGIAVSAQGLSFSYPGGTKLQLDDVNLNVDAGEKVLLKGVPGEGKSTLLKLIAGMYCPSKGKIYVDGNPIQSLNLLTYRNRVGVCLPEETLFNGTVIENISLGRSWISDEDVVSLIKQAGLSEAINELSDGIDTVIGPENMVVAPYLAKSILLLRAVAGKPKLLLLEYAFDELAEGLQKRLVDFVFDENRGFTLIAISRTDILLDKVNKVFQVTREEIKNITN